MLAVFAIMGITVVGNSEKWGVHPVATVICLNLFLFSTLGFIFFDDGAQQQEPDEAEDDESGDEDFDPKDVRYIEKSDRKEQLERDSGSESEGSSGSSGNGEDL